MAPALPKHSKPWTAQDDAQLRTLAEQNTPPHVIALKLQRTLAAIRARATSNGVSLRGASKGGYVRQRP